MGSASNPLHKTAETAPSGQADYCTYVEVSGIYTLATLPGAGSGDYETTYRLYLGSDNMRDYNLLRNRAYTVNVTLRGRNKADMRVESEPLIDLSAKGTANCYIVSKPSGYYTFDATVMGNGATTPAFECDDQSAPAIVPEALAPDDAILVWESGTKGSVIVPGSVALSADGRYIRFKLSSSVGGNAVIAATKEGTIIWSWHIWSTTYDPETSYDLYTTRTITADGYNQLPERTVAMMKVNLGATTEQSTSGRDALPCYGLLYQWGRKDPFPGANTFYSSSNESGTFSPLTNSGTTYYEPWTRSGAYALENAESSIRFSIEHPTYFLIMKRLSAQQDWVADKDKRAGQRDNLWGNPNASDRYPNPELGAKSIYDPCPAGWRVPAQDTWTRFTYSGIKAGTAGEMNIEGKWTYGFRYYYGGDQTGETTAYPATGYRSAGDVKLVNIGGRSYYWYSSPPSMSDTYRPKGCALEVFSINTGGGNVRTDPFSTQYVPRAGGCSVRCTKE